MSLNIKDERTHELVRELAERTGTTQTAAVRQAVAARIAELDRAADPAAEESRASVARRVVADFQADLTPEERDRLLAADDWMYDERGLRR